MPIGIVYILEIHQIQKQNRQLPFLSCSLGNRMTQTVIKQITVCKPCQRIMVGEVEKLIRHLGTFHFGSKIEPSIDHHNPKRDEGEPLLAFPLA